MNHIAYFDDVPILEAESHEQLAELLLNWEKVNSCYSVRSVTTGNVARHYSRGQYNRNWIKSKSTIKAA